LPHPRGCFRQDEGTGQGMARPTGGRAFASGLRRSQDGMSPVMPST
jgi:hypothetical protein